MSARIKALQQHFERIHRDHMQDLPITNAKLAVEAIGFRRLDGHLLGVLITPWFMNLVLLPGNDEWSGIEQGSTVNYSLPAGEFEFTTSTDSVLGIYLTAVLFRTVVDFPDQDTARMIAEKILADIVVEGSRPGTGTAFKPTQPISRRSLFTMLGGE